MRSCGDERGCGALEGQTQELAVGKEEKSRDELEDSPKEETEMENTRMGAGESGTGSICGPPSDC